VAFYWSEGEAGFLDFLVWRVEGSGLGDRRLNRIENIARRVAASLFSVRAIIPKTWTIHLRTPTAMRMVIAVKASGKSSGGIEWKILIRSEMKIVIVDWVK
jgi:hypothetical protein